MPHMMAMGGTGRPVTSDERMPEPRTTRCAHCGWMGTDAEIGKHLDDAKHEPYSVQVVNA